MAGSIFRRGAKRELFSSDEQPSRDAEAQELNAKLGELQELWRQPKGGSKKETSLGVWLQELAVVRVAQARSKLLQHMGFTWRSDLHLFPEEAVYLMDRGTMLLSDATGRLIPLEEAVRLMCATGCDMPRYLVYCHFMRSGLYIKRHPAVWTIPQTAGSAIAGMCATSAWRYDITCEPAQAEGSDGLPDPPPGAAPSSALSAGPPSSDPGVSGSPPFDLLHAAPHDEMAHGLTIHQAQVQARQRGWWPGLGEAHPWLAPAGHPADLEGLRRCEVSEVPACGGAALSFPPISCEPPAGTSTASQRVFDVFKPNNRLSRRQPDRPMAHICIAERPPSLADICAVPPEVDPTGGPSRLTLFAFVEDGVVSLFEGRLLDSQLP
eukprot:jgi/Tetstr1/432447/TSEL_021823.t1